MDVSVLAMILEMSVGNALEALKGNSKAPKRAFKGLKKASTVNKISLFLAS